METAYAVETSKSVSDAVVAVLKAVEQKGWAVFAVIDLQERLIAKGFAQKPVKVIEICSAKHANAMLNKNRLVSLCMPCRIAVFEDGKTRIATMRPVILAGMFDGISVQDVELIDADLRTIVDAAA
ncbi:DUF302 domain-containing protein [Candidatus Woesearchaeota archaeon]|nr:DUF302 domain-containing protein [Candidatus Woesearchaeota archaeon]